MGFYVLRRVGHGILLAFAVSVFTFALVDLAPGTYFDELKENPRISPETVALLNRRYGLDQPMPLRYERWVKSAVHGDLGISLAYNMPVTSLLLPRAANTILLTGLATIVAWMLAIPLGVWSAAGTRSWRGHVVETAASGLLVVPEMILALACLWIAVRTHALPVGGMASTGFAELELWEKLKDLASHLVIPTVVLALGMLPVLVRHVRSSMQEALSATFVFAARAHGIPRRWVLLRYALPAAANPLISLFGFSLAGLLSASMLVEIVIEWPGLGHLLLDATQSRDVYVVIGAVMLSSLLVIFGNLVADLLLYAADPRIRSGVS
jgi:peptide/nickel transport system permease protein